MENKFKQFYFIPTKLIELKKEVEDTHMHGKGSPSDIKNLDDLKIFIMTIVGLRKNEILPYSIQLNMEDINILIRYIIDNRYNVSLVNIIELIKIKCDEENLKDLYIEYQNNYLNSNIIDLFKILLDIERFEDGVRILNIGDKEFIHILECLDKKLPIKYLMDIYIKSNLDIGIDKYIDRYNFRIDSKIYEDLFKQLLYISNENQFMRTSDDILIEFIKMIELDETARFFDNYLNKMKYNNLSDKILKYIHLEFDNPKNHRYNGFWNYIEDINKDKYMKWYEIEKIREFFDGDERFSFWHKYIQEDIADLLNANREQLFLKFDKFYVVEFKEEGNAGYIYPKDEFENRFLDKAVSNKFYSNDIYKSYQKDHIEHKRIIHSGLWQNNTARRINYLLS